MADIDLDLDDTYARVKDPPQGDSDKPVEQTKCDTVAECKKQSSPERGRQRFPIYTHTCTPLHALVHIFGDKSVSSCLWVIYTGYWGYRRYGSFSNVYYINIIA